MFALSIPTVQRNAGSLVSTELSKYFKTKVSIESVNLGLFDQLIIEGVDIEDLQQKPMLHIDKLAASVELIPLLEGKIIVHTGQIFHITANLYQEKADSPANFQFLIDALSSKKEKKEPTKLDLRINSFILRDGQISFNQLFKDKKETFDLAHLKLTDLNAHISLKVLTNDSINAQIRELAFKEQSGLVLKQLKLQVEGNLSHAIVRNLEFSLPNTSIQTDSLEADYNAKEGFSIAQLKTLGTLKDMTITLSDFSFLVPKLKKFEDPIHLTLDFQQDGNQLKVNHLAVHSSGNYINLDAAAQANLPQNGSTLDLTADIHSLNIQPSGYSFIFNNLNLGKTPEILTRLGRTHFAGKVHTNLKSAQFEGNLSTALGKLLAKANLNEDKKIKGDFKSSDFLLGTLLANSHLGSAAFSVHADGSLTKKIPTGKITGKIDYFDYNNYRFKDIQVNSQYNGQDIQGLLSINDNNVQANLEGKALLQQKRPAYQVQLDVDKLDLLALGFSKKNAVYQGKLKASCSGNNINDILGDIRLEDFQMQTPEDFYELDSLVISAKEQDGKRQVNLASNFLEAKIEGEYLYSTLTQSFIQVLERYMPSLLKTHPTYTPHNQFSLSATLRDAAPLNHLLNIPLTLDEDLTIDGQINDLDKQLNLNIAAGSFDYSGTHYELAKIFCKSDDYQLHSSVNINRVTKNKTLSLAVNAIAKDDILLSDISWDNNQVDGTFKGTLNAQTKFQQSFGEPIHVNVNILPSDIILNDTAWHIRPSRVDYQRKKIIVDKLTLENGPRHLIVNGLVGNDQTDTLKADLKEINLEYAFDALNFHPVDLSGIVTGKAVAVSLLKGINAEAQLFVRNFHFEHGLLGNMNLHGKWDKEQGGIYLNGYISEFASESNDSTAIWKAFRRETAASALTHIEGIVSPDKKMLDLHIDAENTNIHFIESYVGGIFKDVEGRASGWGRVAGTFKDIDVTAALKAQARAKVISLNTTYQMESDSILLKTNRMEFNNLHLADKDGHKGLVNGTVEHYYLHNMKYNFDISADNLLCYDTHSFDEDSFYATAYGSGHITLQGGGNNLHINGDLETKPGTIVAYNASTPEDITDTQFITFVDKTPKNENISQESTDVLPTQEEEEPTNIYINLNLNCTPDATIRVLMDNISGDDIICHGTGNFQAEYFNKGALKMYGIFNITQGVYKMSLQEVIRKDFNLNSGTVTFNGGLLDGILDVQAIYTVNSASLRDLSPSATFSQKSTTKVNCLMNLTGNLLKPQITFDLELPNVSDEDKSMVKSLVATDDQMNRQIIYLLSIGRFYTDELNQDATNQTNQAMNSLLTSTISGQFNQILSQVANTSNWNFGANLNPGQDGLNRMEFQTMLSGSLFNNRLLINGNFGYRENALANSNFVGDFDIQWLLNQSGTISLKAYNETNDRYFTKNSLTTQGIGILFKRDFHHWSDLFKTRNKKKSATEKTAADSTNISK